MKREKPISLFQWIWKSYIRTSVIPLVLVELVFIGIYFVTNEWSRERQTLSMKNEVLNEIRIVASQESAIIDSETRRISSLTVLYSDSIAHALNQEIPASEENLERLVMSPEGAYYSKADTTSGGAAIFYSGINKVGAQQKNKVERLLPLQPFMKSIVAREPLAAAVYFNTYDSLNIIYPYFDVMTQYQSQMNIPEFNFYYEADAEHNPERKAVWTDAYLDPAGNGWMASSIAPVYRGNVLEGVAGIDVTINTFREEIQTMDIPWKGLGLLVSNNGTILAMPDRAEQLFGIQELTSHNYQEAVKQDTFKPDEFNLFAHKDLQAIAVDIAADKQGLSEVRIDGQKQMLAWSTMENTGWKFIILAAETNIFAVTNHLNHELFEIGMYMILGLFLFYIIYFAILNWRSRVMSGRISEPLMEINRIAMEIGQGRYHQEIPEIHVTEIRETAEILSQVGSRLGEAYKSSSEAKDALEDREANMNAMIQSIDDMIAEINETGVIEKVWSIDRRYDYAMAKSFEGKHIDALLDPQTTLRFMSILSEVLATQETVGMEYEMASSRGTVWMQALITPIKRKNEPVRKVCVISRDITERKYMEESLFSSKELAETANKAKSEFLSSMSHELRTPMNAILGFAQLLEYESSDPLSASQQENVREIIKAGKHLLQLISEILDLTRIESGRMALSIEDLRLGDVLEECFTWMQPICSQHSIGFRNEALSMYEELIRCDRIRMKQVLLNILSNSIKYNNPNGMVTVSVHHAEARKLVIVVKDTGVGIREEDLIHIFEPFHRIPQGKQIEGTGIGLTVSRRLLGMMDGEIQVTSVFGEGSVFKILIPLGEEG
ncbi:ATP-binding protein [Paenibacillus sp. FSL R7-0312]|uniref:sensor histidine kinase n=1 Tax=Paenibacillus sp. FSL R7-0312 TaxID=2921682 RepID=UPI0030FA4670